MKNPERQPRADIDEIKGDYVDVSIMNPEKFRAYLETESSFEMLYASTYAKELPSPLYNAQLGYKQQEGEINIIGDLHFRSDVLDVDESVSWHATLSNAIDTILRDNDYAIYSLPHEIFTRHIILSDEYAAYLKFTTETRHCCVEMSLERIYDLERELDEPISDTLLKEVDTYKLFKDFTTIWANTIDTIAHEYGFQKRKKTRQLTQIVLEAPRQDESLYTSEQNAKAVKEAESGLPELERQASPDKSFRMLGGLERPKQQLQDIVDTFNDPVGTQMYGISASHFMLYGPSGTGKTSLVEALTGEIKGATLQYVNSSDIMVGIVGESGQNLTKIFNEAFTHDQPHILFFDEFDAIAGKGNNDSVSHIEVKKLLNQHIITATKDHPNVVIAAATNLDSYHIEDALIRSGRLHPIAVPKPNEDERSDIWAAVLAQSFANFTKQTVIAIDSSNGELHDNQQFVPYGDDINPPMLATLTEGMTGADFTKILHTARYRCYRHYKQTGESRRVSQADLIKAIQDFDA